MKKIINILCIIGFTTFLLWAHHTAGIWLYLEKTGIIDQSSTGMRFFILVCVHLAIYILALILLALLIIPFSANKSKPWAFNAFSLSLVITFFNLMIFSDSVIDLKRDHKSTKCAYAEALENQFCFFEINNFEPLLGSFHSVSGGLGGKAGGIRETWYRFFITLRDQKNGQLYHVDTGTEFVDRHSVASKNLQTLYKKRMQAWRTRPSDRPLRLILSRDAFKAGKDKSYPLYLQNNQAKIQGLKDAKINNKVFAIYKSAKSSKNVYWYIKNIGFWAISIFYFLNALLFISLTLPSKDDKPKKES